MKKGFENLKVWQMTREYRKEIYSVSAQFPSAEKFHLQVQIREAAVSLTANIAEGYGRYSYQECIQFCRISRGSLSEILDHLYTALDEGYITRDRFENLYKKGKEIERAINGYISYLKRMRKG